MGFHRVGHDWSDVAHITFSHIPISFCCNCFVIISYYLIQFYALCFFFSCYITVLGVIYFHPQTQWITIRTSLIIHESGDWLKISSLCSLIWAYAWACHQVIFAGQSQSCVGWGSLLTCTRSLLQKTSLGLYLWRWQDSQRECEQKQERFNCSLGISLFPWWFVARAGHKADLGSTAEQVACMAQWEGTGHVQCPRIEENCI